MSVHGHHGVHCVIVGIIVDEFGHSTVAVSIHQLPFGSGSNHAAHSHR